MNASEKNKCKRCGAVVRRESTEKLCPACLMSGALEPPGGEGETISLAPGESLSLYGPSEFPCEFGGYRLLGLLGRGGMGTVYEAEQLPTGRRVALKMLGQQLDSPDMRKRFLREGRLAAGVNHPNSLYIFGSEEIEGLPVITMEIAGAGTLKDKLKKNGPLPVTEAVDAILDVISGLESAFAGGVLHRDIKPSNCFVSPEGSVKVGDFGLSVSTLARTDTFVTAHGKIMGTPAYASPEQLRGDALDVRSDIYSVGATLFSLLTNRAPFEGDNAVQVVANAVNKKPKPLTELRQDVPPGLERVVARCLAKEPGGRYPDYTALRNVLLPFSSKEPEPASMKVRSSVGWIDYLIAFLIPYVTIMLFIGADKLLVRPLVERTLYSARYYIALFSFGFLYFSIVEGIWGGGLGKRLKGLRVVRTNGRPPGIGRALIRILIPIACVEGIRMPLMMALISDANWTGLQTALYVVAAIVCGWIPVLLILRARRENGFATVWDLASGTRVVVKPKGTVRPLIEPAAKPEIPAEGADSLGPYRIIKEMVPGKWIVGTDPVLRREVWLMRRNSSELSLARRNLSRHSRLRWLQKAETTEATWDAFEATEGVPFTSLVEDGKRVPWSSLRHWLHDLASELWDATGDKTLPAELSLDHVWITTQGHAILLDEAWPGVKIRAERIGVGDLAGQQRFLNAVAACVESTSMPLHARGVLQNLADGKFEKLSFLTGILRGLLDKPAEVSKGIRAGSIFMLGLYVWITVFVGYYQAERVQQWNDSLGGLVMISAMVVLGTIALIQLLTLLLFRTTASHATFRLAVVNAKGEPANRVTLLRRWAIVWLPLFVPMSFAALLINRAEGIAFICALVLPGLWIGAAVYSVIVPNRGLHDRLAGTWVVRR
ncbi:MAG: protein kinase [Planctomycetes bacterium]|nr:protein kinase [Planctomycetota bacterium]MBL7144105.1 protein kinase [Phycisphaerae bacterium]